MGTLREEVSTFTIFCPNSSCNNKCFDKGCKESKYILRLITFFLKMVPFMG